MQYLAIIDKDPESGIITVVENHGPCTNQEFVSYQATLFETKMDWDTLLDTVIDFLQANNVLTDTELTINGYTLWSLVEFSQRLLADLPEKFKESPETRIALTTLKGAARLFKKGRKIDLSLAEIKDLGQMLQEPLLRQLLRDKTRRDQLRAVMPTEVLLYENPPQPN